MPAALDTVPPLATVEIPRLDILSVGRWNGDLYTTADLDDMVSAFHELSGSFAPPCKLGHNDEQRLIASDGLPAVGWISKLWREGQTLYASIANVPAKLAQVIAAGGYRTRSAEIWFDTEFSGKRYRRVLSALSWLGADIPAVAGLSDIVALYSDQMHRQSTATAALSHAARNVRTATMPRRLATGPSLQDMQAAVQKALDSAFQPMAEGEDAAAGTDGPSSSIEELFSDSVVVSDNDGDAFFEIPYTYDAGSGEATLGTPTPVKRGPWQPTSGEQEPDADDTDAAQLPASTDGASPPAAQMARLAAPVDSDVERLVVEANSDFDKLMAKLNAIAAGKPGVSELRSLLSAAQKALGRLNVSKPKASTPAQPVQNSRAQEEEMALIDEMRTLLDLSDGATAAEVKQAVLSLRATHVSLADHKLQGERLEQLERRELEREADQLIDQALRQGKLAPKQREWARAYALRDREGFTTYLESAPKVVSYSAAGSEASQAAPQVDEGALEIARRMGLSADKLASHNRPLAELMQGKGL